jgi:hypothetical protein
VVTTTILTTATENSPPSFTPTQIRSVSELLKVNQEVARFVLTDRNAEQTHTWSLLDDDSESPPLLP